MIDTRRLRAWPWGRRVPAFLYPRRRQRPGSIPRSASLSARVQRDNLSVLRRVIPPLPRRRLVALVGMMLLEGCSASSGTPTPRAVTSSTSSPEAAKPTTTNPPASAAPCSAASIRAAVLRTGVAAGSIDFIVGLHNEGVHPCTLSGPPAIQMLDPQGRNVIRPDPACLGTGCDVVRIPVGGDAFFMLQAPDGTGYGSARFCPSVTTLIVSLPSGVGQVTTGINASPCSPAYGQLPSVGVSQVAAGTG